MSNTQTTDIRKTKLKIILFGTIGAIFFLCSILFIIVYAVPYAWAQTVRNQLFLPMVVVDGKQWISFREVAGDLKSIRRFYETQDFSEVGLRVDFSSDDGKKRLKVREKELINKLIEDRAIESLARSRGIVVTDEMVDQGVRRKLDEFGSTTAVTDDLERLYGWSLNDFKSKIVRSSLYEEELSKLVLNEDATIEQARKKIGEAETSLARGSPFDRVAKDYSDGRTAKDGGTLGWFMIGDLTPELRKGVETQKIGVPGTTIESALGFHIVIVDAVKEEGGEKWYQLRQIFVRKISFADWLTDHMKDMHVWVFDSEYDWNADTARLEFHDADMKNFERDLIRNKTGDAAFLFY
jgi:hypothetical protein